MRALAVALAFGLLLTSCRSEVTPTETVELRVGVRGVGSLDPLVVGSGEGPGGEALTARQVFEGLVTYDPVDLRVRPALAGSWTVSPDARTFTFLLRPRTRFHDGREVGIGDVLYSLNRLARAACEPAESAVAGAPSYLLSGIVGYPEVAGTCEEQELSGLSSVGESSLMVSLSEPWADFPQVLGHAAAAIVPGGAANEDLAREPVGTGPYRVTRPWDGTALRLERFDGHWGTDPEIERVRLIGYPEASLAYLDLVQERIHYAPVPLGRVGQAKRRFGDEGFATGVGVYVFGFNLGSEKVASSEFRRGLSMAVDRASIASAIFDDTREPAHGMVSPAILADGRDPCGDACAFDPDAARAAIASAHPEGAPDIVIGVSEEGSNPAVAEAVAEMLDRVGVTAHVVERPLVEHVRSLGEVDLFQFAWLPPYPSADGILWPLFRSGSRDNHSGYARAEVDELLARARSTVNDAERARLFRDAEEVILSDLPMIPLFWYRSAVAVDPRVRPVGENVVDGMGITAFTRLTFEG